MKTARTRDCRICMKERITIMQALRDDKYKVINDNYAASDQIYFVWDSSKGKSTGSDHLHA